MIRRAVLCGAVVSAVAVLGASCGPGPCGPANCFGCCSATDECVSGNTAASCGSTGSQCSACTGSQTCEVGVCKGGGGGSGGSGGSGGAPGCNNQTCTGCCFNNTCQSGNTAGACGKAAMACTACQSAEICKADQTCGIDPESNWRIFISAVTVAPNDNGNAWDPLGGAPDIGVDLWCPASSSSVTAVQPVVNDAFSATWSQGGCTMKARDLMSAGFSLNVVDRDADADDPITGVAKVTPTNLHLVVGSLYQPSVGKALSLTISFTRQ